MKGGVYRMLTFIKEQFPTILKYTMKSRLMNFQKRTIIIWPKSHK